jgi:hypothetical protein
MPSPSSLSTIIFIIIEMIGLMMIITIANYSEPKTTTSDAIVTTIIANNLNVDEIIDDEMHISSS